MNYISNVINFELKVLIAINQIMIETCEILQICLECYLNHFL